MKNLKLYYVATFVALFFVVILFALIFPQSNQISLENPTVNIILNSTVSSPVLIEGTIPRSWTFEASFPVEIVDDTGKNINTVPVAVNFPDESSLTGTFSASIPFSTTSKNGYIIIRNDNPSGLPENDKSFKIPVNFSSSSVDTSTWKIYKNDKYGFEFKYPNDWYLISNNQRGIFVSNKPILLNKGPYYSSVGQITFEVLYTNSSVANGLGQIDYVDDDRNVYIADYKFISPNKQLGVSINYRQNDKSIEYVFLVTDQIFSTFAFTEKSQTNNMKVKIYQTPKDISQSCESVNYIEVDLPKSSTPLKDSLEYLIAHLDNPKGFKLVSAVINNGVATLKFDDPNFYSTGGSCHVNSLSSQIEKTALQFSAVKSVKFVGPEHLFQP